MRYLYILILFTIFFGGCKDNNPVDSVDSKGGKPLVSLISPANNYNAVDSVMIEADAADDKGVVKVEIYIDNAAGDFRTFYSKPYKYTWNTSLAADGSAHTVFAKAYDADGNSTTSDVINISVYRLQPSNLSATLISDSLALIKWHDNSTIETGFEIEQRSRNTQFAVVKTAKTNDTSAYLTGPFLADSVYYFRIAAKTNTQKSGYSNIDSLEFTIDSPTNVKATVISDTLIALTWQDNSNNETGFTVEQSSDGIAYSPYKTFAANSVSGNVTGIYNTTSSYYFRVKAISKYSSSTFAVSAPVKIKINPPSDLKMTSVNSSSVKLEWKDNCTFDKWAEVERKINTGSFEVIAKPAAGINYFTDTALDKANTYYYRVKAYTYHNSSDYIDLLKISATLKGYQTTRIFGADENVNSISVSPDGKYIASGGSGNIVKIRNTKDGKVEKSFTGFTAPVNYVAFSPDGLQVAACSQDKTIKIWRVSDGQLMKDFTSHTASVSSICYSKDGQLLLSGGYDRKVNLWRVTDGVLLKTLQGHSASVTAVTLSPDGDLAASGSTSEENKIKTWRMIDTSFVRDLPDSSSPVYALCFSPSSQYLVSGYANGNIILWYASSGKYTNNLPGHLSAISSVSFNGDGTKLISASYDKTIKVWRISDGQLQFTLDGHTDIVKQAVFFPDNQVIASCGFDKSIRIWEVVYQWGTGQ